jgi:uncharacterized protein
MPIQPTYPGVYIEEIPSNNHTVTPAPTSLAVFVGYTHPFKTQTFGVAVRLFSFADYERNFGGFFSNDVFEAEGDKFSSVAHAVYQFFLNGGSDCYVVGLQAQLHNGVNTRAIASPTGDLGLKTAGKKITFTGLEPTEASSVADALQITITVSNVRKTKSDDDTADLVITYGTRVETFRSVNLTGKSDSDPFIKANYIENRINNVSQLVTISTPDDTAFNTATPPLTLSVSPDTTGGFNTVFNAPDFNDVFQADTDLDEVPIFNLMILPGVVDVGVQSAAIAFCERKHAFFIMDPDRTKDPTNIGSYFDTAPRSANGALYFPYMQSYDPSNGDLVEVPPSGTVAGIFARTDVNRGVWKAPAGLEASVLNSVGVVTSGRMNDPRQGVLNDIGVNCVRTFPDIGTVVYGSRTLVSANPAFQQYKYVPVRRMTLFIEQTLLRNLTWATFEPNDTPLWTALKLSVESFMLGLFNNGGLQGSSPSQAFRVICDQTTTTPDDQVNGIVNIVVLFAPLKPAEFVIAKVGLLAGQAQS